MVFLAICSAQASAAPWVTGTARSATDNNVLYREFHYPAPTLEGLSGSIEYLGNDNRLIARKNIDYTDSLTAPAVEQLDIRTQTRFFTRYEEGALHAGFQRGNNTLQTQTYTSTDDLVVDAGFDPYVRNNWSLLRAGRSVAARFHVPSRLESVRISINPVDRRECAQASGELLCLLVRPAGLLRVVGWFLEPLHLAYDLETRRLLMFKGTSNLADDEGRPQSVVILYDYGSQASAL